MLVRAVYGEVVFLRNKERDPVLHLFNVAPAILVYVYYHNTCCILMLACKLWFILSSVYEISFCASCYGNYYIDRCNTMKRI